MKQYLTNPYPTQKGFGLCVHRARQALEKLGRGQFANIYTRGFDNCFEMGDGDAVVWALMHKAQQESDQYGRNPLTVGIQTMFSQNLNGLKYPQLWLDVYHGDGLASREKSEQLALF